MPVGDKIVFAEDKHIGHGVVCDSNGDIISILRFVDTENIEYATKILKEWKDITKQFPFPVLIETNIEQLQGNISLEKMSIK